MDMKMRERAGLRRGEREEEAREEEKVSSLVGREI
jgi:hypothetical protein